MMGVELISEQWCDARQGQEVKLSRPDGESYYGVVDDRSDDGAFVWVLTIGTGRKLFHVSDGFQTDFIQ